VQINQLIKAGLHRSLSVNYCRTKYCD